MLKKADRKRIIEGYMEDAGADVFVPRDFLTWLQERPGHECYGLFFGKDEAEAAMAWREDQVRKWVSGLRITVTHGGADKIDVGGVTVTTLPMFVSPMDAWSAGGGYHETDAGNADHIKEHGRQALAALTSWLERYGGAAHLLGVDVSGCETVAAALGVAVG
jgi:hypothetical protein